MAGIRYSIVIPVYNSENSLEELVLRLRTCLDQLEGGYEIILVNDGSQDNSWNRLKTIRKENENNLIIVDLSRNYGQHNAQLCGLNLSAGEFVFTIDDDLQIPPEEIPKLIARQKEEKAEVVYGIYPDKQHASYRNLGSKLVEKLISRFGLSEGKGSSFKLISRSLVDKICQSRFEYIYLDEIIGWYSDRIGFQEVDHHVRKSGNSGYSFYNLITITLRIILNYTALPLKVMTYGGLTASIICFALGIYYIYDKLVNDIQLGFTSIIVAITFSTGIILFCLGIIGEYIRRLFFIQQYKPPFFIRELIK